MSPASVSPSVFPVLPLRNTAGASHNDGYGRRAKNSRGARGAGRLYDEAGTGSIWESRGRPGRTTQGAKGGGGSRDKRESCEVSEATCCAGKTQGVSERKVLGRLD